MYVNEHSSRLDMGLDYDSTVMLTCKLLFAAAKAIVDVGPHMPRQLYLLDFFFVQDQGGFGSVLQLSRCSALAITH